MLRFCVQEPAGPLMLRPTGSEWAETERAPGETPMPIIHCATTCYVPAMEGGPYLSLAHQTVKRGRNLRRTSEEESQRCRVSSVLATTVLSIPNGKQSLCGNGGNEMPSLGTRLHVISAGNSPLRGLYNKMKITSNSRYDLYPNKLDYTLGTPTSQEC
jgi:hypothetical protein